MEKRNRHNLRLKRQGLSLKNGFCGGDTREKHELSREMRLSVWEMGGILKNNL